MPTPQLLHNTIATAALKRGFDQMARLLALTLGPTQGNVVIPSNLNGKPEVLNDAATIARRVLQLPDRAEDVGAMILRHLVWRMNQRAGDGSAMAAVLAQALLAEAHRVVVAGANPMLVKRGVDRAARVALAALTEQARPVRDAEDLALVAFNVVNDPNLSNALGEVYWRIGADGHVTIEEYVAPYLACELVEGGRWKGRLASPYFITNHANQCAEMDAGPIALVAGTLSALEDVQPFLELVAQTEDKRGVLIAQDIQSAALATLAANFQQGQVKVVGVELRSPDTQRRADFEDLAALTGAAVLFADLGQSPRRLTRHDLGTVRRVEAGADDVVIVGDGEHSAAVARQVQTLQARLARLPETDEGRADLTQRLARLSGQTASLKIGAYTETERAAIKQRAEKGLRALPLALREGVAPGGGVAYLNCIEAARAVPAEGDEAWGVAALARALEAPFRQLAANAGAASPGAVLAEARRQGQDYGYDAEYGEIVSMLDEDIVDPMGVLRQALEVAVSGAMMALTVETIVLHREPKTVYEP
ncbi:MAG: chaperonin GroEL [Anaerolineae bacterium]|nr:chaperonin GroEL [Anaerolineae bacterium]